MSISGRKGWWRPDAWAPAFLIIAPFFINKLIYARCPSYQAFLVTDYTCHILIPSPGGLTLGFPDQRRVDSRLANTRGAPCLLRFGLILTLRWLGWPRSGRRTGRRRGGF